jgi:putative component of membrane protein insertase Oxa1/YidC/SpoIIIJ protein YidD
MRLGIWLVLWVHSWWIHAQDIDSLIFSHNSVVSSPYNHPEVKYSVSINPIVFIGKTALFFYQKVISDQIGAVCAHEPSCSEFCRQSIEKSGFVRGVLLSGDRLQRCTPFNVMNLRKNSENLRNGKIYDPPVSLRSRKKTKKS